MAVSTSLISSLWHSLTSHNFKIHTYARRRSTTQIAWRYVHIRHCDQAHWWLGPLLDGLWQQHLLPCHPHPPCHPPQHLLSWQCRQSTQVLSHYHLAKLYISSQTLVLSEILPSKFNVTIPSYLPWNKFKTRNVEGPSLSLSGTSVESTRTRPWSQPER